MATISNTPRPGYAWDATDNCWYPIGTGPHTHADYITSSSAINPTIVDAKGDIIAASAADTPARLAVGNNGETLVADSSTSTGLRWQGDYAAGKNKVINGDFGIWQRGTTFNPATAASGYCSDRWFYQADVAPTTASITQQTFTPGTAPVSGYEGQFFLRSTITTKGSCSVIAFSQRIEDVRTFAGQTVTVSLWAKADTAGRILQFPQFIQNFGSGGSASVPTYGTSITLTTSWVRYTQTFTIPSISGKTIGTSSYLEFYFQQVAVSGNVIDIWGVQIEESSVASDFQTATGTIQGELAACQRYYERISSPSNALNNPIGWGMNASSVAASIFYPMKVPKRVLTSTIEWSSLRIVYYTTGGATVVTSPTVIVASPAGTEIMPLNCTAPSLSAGLPVWLDTTGTTGYLAVSAEL